MLSLVRLPDANLKSCMNIFVLAWYDTLQEIMVLRGPSENPEVLLGTLGSFNGKQRCFIRSKVLHMHVEGASGVSSVCK